MKSFLIFLGILLQVVLIAALEARPLIEKDSFKLNLKGYYKNLFFASKRQATDDPYIADLNRLRTEWDVQFFKIFSAKVVWDHEIIGGDYVNTEEFAAREVERNTPYGDLDYEIVRRNNFFYGQSFYRAYGTVDPGFLTFTVGRQRIDWGIMRLFSPGDLFSRIPIYDIEKDERVGVTAANLVIPIGETLRINPVYAFQSDWDRSRLGGRITKTVGHFQVSLLGGRFLRDAVFGVDVTGDIRQAGVRAEVIYDISPVSKNFLQAAVGVDYGFENSLYLALEYFFNGQGTNNVLTGFPFPPSANPIQSVHQHFIGFLGTYDLTPLWKSSLQMIADINAGSFFLNPEMKYEILSWLEVKGGAQLPVGRTSAEFTPVPNIYYFQTEIFF